MTTPQPAITARWHFGIPIYARHLPLFADHQAAIAEHIQQLQDIDKDQGIKRSNQGGWHSSDRLHLTQHEDTRWLILRLLEIASQCIRNFEGERPLQDIKMVAAWANINCRGQWNAPHEHLPCSWSEVFYVDAGEPLADADDPEQLEGKIMFFDPLPLGDEWKRPVNINYTPITGAMLLFPAFLTHMVAPYFGDQPRISLAFNLLVERG